MSEARGGEEEEKEPICMKADLRLGSPARVTHSGQRSRGMNTAISNFLFLCQLKLFIPSQRSLLKMLLRLLLMLGGNLHFMYSIYVLSYPVVSLSRLASFSENSS